MAHFKKLPQKKNEGKIIYGDGIVDGIVLLAMNEVSNARLYSNKIRGRNQSKSIKVFFDKDGVHIDIYVRVHFLQCVSDIAFKIQETIRHNVESMTDYKVAAVNVIVSGIMFTERPAEVSTENKTSAIERYHDENLTEERP